MSAFSIEDRTLLYAVVDITTLLRILAENKITSWNITSSKTVAYRSSIVTLARVLVCSSKLSLAVCE